MTKAGLLVVLFILFQSVAARAQLYTYVYGELTEGSIILCQDGGWGIPDAACHGSWQNSSGTQLAGVAGQTLAAYGEVSGGAGAESNCSVNCELHTNAYSREDVTDAASFQNVPDSGAYFLIKLALRGQVTDPLAVQTSFSVQLLTSDGHGGTCSIDIVKGTCYAYVPVTSATTSVQFVISNVDNAFAWLITQGGAGTTSQSAASHGSITALAVVNSKGQVLKNVVINTSSGHKYPL